jgi:hypothetical protein
MPDEAETKAPSKGNGSLGCGWILLGLGLAGVAGALWWRGHRAEQKLKEGKAAALAEFDAAREKADRARRAVPQWAWDEAQKYVSLQLVAPSTAKFACPQGEPWKDCVEQLAETTYRVDGMVDAQNRLGVPLRHHFTVTLRYVGNQTWMPIEGPSLSGP